MASGLLKHRASLQQCRSALHSSARLDCGVSQCTLQLASPPRARLALARRCLTMQLFGPSPHACLVLLLPSQLIGGGRKPLRLACQAIPPVILAIWRRVPLPRAHAVTGRGYCCRGGGRRRVCFSACRGTLLLHRLLRRFEPPFPVGSIPDPAHLALCTRRSCGRALASHPLAPICIPIHLGLRRCRRSSNPRVRGG